MTKIALCFLTYGNLSKPKLWNDLLNNNKEKFNVYIHNKDNFIDTNLQKYCLNSK